jgi:3D (Asp-Asp-Asp) domain-containing protein
MGPSVSVRNIRSKGQLERFWALIRLDQTRRPYRGSSTFYKAVFATCLLYGLIGLPLASLGLAKVEKVVPLFSSQPLDEPPFVEDAFHYEASAPISPEGDLLEALRQLDGPPSATVEEIDEQWQTIRMRVTAYCACSICCGKYADGYTANNHRIRPGDAFVAADKQVPFGTEMIIPGYNGGRCVKVMDRGRLIKGNWLDIFMHTHQEAREWGVRYLDVRVKTD